MNRPIQTLSSRVLWTSRWYSLRQDAIRLPDGSEGTYTVVDKGGAAWVLPVLPNGDLVLIRHYRYTLDQWCWEIPAGGIDPDETPTQAAVRELREEIGGMSERWQSLGRYATMNGIGNEWGHFFIAFDVTLGEAALEPAEVLSVHPTPAARALEMARTGEMDDMQSAFAMLLAEPFLKGPIT